LYLPTLNAIDIYAYAVASNHVHVVVHVDVDKAQGWSDKQVISLWHTLYKGTLITQKRTRDEALSPGEDVTLQDTIKAYRSRLHGISWFMRNLRIYYLGSQQRRWLYGWILFADMHDAYPLGQLKLFSFIPCKLAGRVI
jgi:hypothetical protein